MRLGLISDLHLESYRNGWQTLLCDLQVDVDVLVVAGDLTETRIPLWYDSLRYLSDHYPRVLYVTGNHESYSGTIWRTKERCRDLDLPNVTWLGNTSVVVEGVTFYGGTMWFRDDPLNYCYTQYMNDFTCIEDVWVGVYEENREFERELRECNPDVVISHHLPSQACIAPWYKEDPLNRFFLCSQDEYLHTVESPPRLWLFGHTHDEWDVVVDRTRLVCNPLGYPREKRQDKYSIKLINIGD